MAKITYSEALNFVLTNCELPAEISERLEAAKATLDKRAENGKNRERKLSPSQQKEQDALMAFRNAVYEVIKAEPNRLWSCSELADTFNVSVPKLSAAMKYLVTNNKAIRSTGPSNKVVTYQFNKSE